MAENSAIEWTHHTFNPWRGCTKISPGCDHCYAEVVTARFKNAEWGPGKPRTLAKEAYWNEPLKWNERAKQNGMRERVFCASLADVFDNEVDSQWREWLWGLIKSTPNLDWLLLTKRIGNAAKMLPADWGDGWPNVWLGATIVNQEEAARDIPKLLRTPASLRFLSMEPLLGPVNLRALDCSDGLKLDALTGSHSVRVGPGTIDELLEELGQRTPLPGMLAPVDWVIVGGESGSKARPMHPDWARSLRDQCAETFTPFLFKQWGEWSVVYDRDNDDSDWRNCPRMTNERRRYINLAGGHGFHGERVCFVNRVGKKVAGRILDGVTHTEFPR